MTDFEKLTDKEVLELTEEQIAIYKKLALAAAGVRFPVKPNEPECVEEDRPDLTVYYINQLGDKLIFKNIDEAQAVLNALRAAKTIGQREYNSKIGWEYNYFEAGFNRDYYGNERPLTIESTQVYSKELFSTISTNLQTNRKLREQYNKDKEAYEKILNQATEVTASINERILNVREEHARKEELKERFLTDYLPIANNDPSVAMAFMRNAYTMSDEDVEYIMQDITAEPVNHES